MLQHLLLIWLGLFHPFYVSVTEIEQNQKTKVVQVSARIFYDDLEKAIGKRYKTNINILKPANRKQVDDLISAYVKEHLKIKVNGTDVNLKYVGYEIEEEAAWCYFETPALPAVSRFNIVNNILYEQHESQINMIHAIVNGKRQSTKLDNPANAAAFNF
ncbi:MAG: DUF6702 family protein [Bacteroidota bacterium]